MGKSLLMDGFLLWDRQANQIAGYRSKPLRYEKIGPMWTVFAASSRNRSHRSNRAGTESLCRTFLLLFSALALYPGAKHAFPDFSEPTPLARNGLGASESRNSLEPGIKLYLRLETPVSTQTSHLHGPVKARVVREVIATEGVLIPPGAQVEGRIEKLIPSSSPTDRASLLLRFDKLEISGQPPIDLRGHLAEIENARETVLADGTIQGVLASELPLSHLETALGKLGTDSGDLVKAKEKALGKSDTSIEYPAGADLVFVLDKPLTLRATAAPSRSLPLPDADVAAVARLLEEAPQRASGKNQAPGDPLNLVVIGSQQEIEQTFREAGWSAAERKNAKSVWQTVRAVAGDQGYGRAPVSELYLYGRPEDLAFEKTLNTFVKRHHLRLWRSSATTPDGREIWLGAATHDVGLDIRPGVVSHAIDPDLDAERAKVGADLMVTGRVATVALTARPNPLSEGLTATGASWKTDGRLLVIDLKAP